MLKKERETWNVSKRLGEKKERGKKGDQWKNETYERIQGMRKKRLRRIITSKLNF
jgi:hypothetical protein